MNKRFLTVLTAAVVISGVQALAQNQLQVVISGTCSTLDAQGHIVAQPLNNQTLLQQAAKAGGLTSTAGLGLSYHIGGNSLGDTIDVINRTNGVALTTLYGLYFGESFGRQALLSASHRQMKRLEYIYTSQNDHSLGSALLTDYFILDSNGNTNATYVLGQMQWIVTTDSTHPNTQVCTASFTTLRPWKFQ
ncbi:MAG TPA: hypothetical protein VL793_05595 [Patescibacteria group bacterium]|nr:hypothetical protein [Patescibacteria group bacterium]